MLRVNNLVGFGQKNNVAGTVTLSFLTSSVDTANAAAYTFSSLSFGAADSNRVLIVSIGARRATDTSISSVTIGGVTATAIVTAENTGSGSDFAAIFAANVPTGTTGDVVVTFADACIRCVIGLHSTTDTGGSVTAHDTSTDLTTTPSTTIDVEEGGAVVACSWASLSAGSAAVSWTGVTEDYDTQPETASNGVSGGHDDELASETGRTITASQSGTVARAALAVASWSPA
jgi:hypothetical protein